MKTKPLPKWAMKKYALLWKKFRQKEFEYENAEQTLQEENPNMTSVLINHLKQNKWIDARINPKDTRKRIYKLEIPSNAVENMTSA